MRESKTHAIDGYDYNITQLGAKQGRLVLARVVRIAAAAAEATDPVGKLASALTDAEVDYLCDTFSKTTQVGKDNKYLLLSDCFDDHFAGRYGAMVKWLWAALETNYSSFLADVGLSTESLTAAAKTAMSSTRTSPTSQSGALSSMASDG
jgi:hypothetical protein